MGGLMVLSRKSKLKPLAPADGSTFGKTMCQYVKLEVTVQNQTVLVHYLNMHLCGGKEDADELKRAENMAAMKEVILDKVADPSTANCLITVDSNGERIYAPNEKLAPQWYPWMEANLLNDGSVPPFRDPLLVAKLQYTTKKK